MALRAIYFQAIPHSFCVLKKIRSTQERVRSACFSYVSSRKSAAHTNSFDMLFVSVNLVQKTHTPMMTSQYVLVMVRAAMVTGRARAIMAWVEGSPCSSFQHRSSLTTASVDGRGQQRTDFIAYLNMHT